jgi:hypothetical protein
LFFELRALVQDSRQSRTFHMTEQVGLAVTLQTCIWEVPCSNFGLDTGYYGRFSLFSSVSLGKYLYIS